MGRAAEPIQLTVHQLKELLAKEREFAEAGRHRWADRCRAVRLRAEGYGIDEIASILKRPYRTVQDWCRLFRRRGLRGMEPKTSTRGRPRKMGTRERKLLAKAIERGPRAAGFKGSVWTCPLVKEYIRRRWKVDYHPGHIWHLLRQLGFSVQFPRERLALANRKAQEHWLKKTLPALKKKLK